MRWTRGVPFLLGSILLLSRATPSAAGADVTLWVVQPPGEVVAYDLADFSRVGGVRIPRVAFDDPGRLSINGAGQMLVPLDADHLWIWDGEAAKTLTAPTSLPRAMPSGDPTVPLRQWLLGNERNSLYVLQRESGIERGAATDSTPASLVVRTTNLMLEPREQIVAIPDPPCETTMEPVDTPVPCADPGLWVPGGVVRDFLLLAYWKQDHYPGFEDAIHASCHSLLLRRDAKGWRASELEIWCWEPPLDMAAGGSAWVQADGEAGCCGGLNEDSNLTRFTDADSSRTVFDEWARFRNRNYDVSFFTASASISPEGMRVAYTVHATATATQEIPASAEGHPDTLELASIRRSIADLPLVEIHEVLPLSVVLQQLAHCELVGWASDSEVIVVEKRRVVAVDVTTGHRRPSGIRVRDARDVSVVRALMRAR